MANGEVVPPTLPTFPPPPPPPEAPGRTGPPWEQSGPVVQRFIDTVKGVLMEPQRTFVTMRREGGLGPPLVFAIIGCLIGGAATAVYQTIGGGMGSRWGGGPGSGYLIALPLFLIIGLFIGSGIYHLVLSLLGGARYGFETTFRTVAYVAGATSLINVIPLCGSIIAAVWSLIVTIIGLAEMQDTSQGKAAAAVLIPAVVCCALLFLVFGAAIMAIIMGAAAMNR